MALKIPSIAIESGGNGNQVHSLDEWIDTDKDSSAKGVDIAMGILLALAGIH